MSVRTALTSPRRPWIARRRARTLAIALSLASGLATTALPILARGAAVRPQLLLAGIAGVFLIVALFGWEPGFALAAIAAGAEYALRLKGRSDLDGVAVLEAAALFATVELGLRTRDARSVARPDREVTRAAAWRLVVIVLGAVAAALVVLLVGSRKLPAPTVGLAIGLGAAAALLVAAERLRRRVTRV